MNFYKIETGSQGNPDYVFLKDYAEGVNPYSWRIAGGEPMGALYPADAKLKMGPRSRGITPASLIGNIHSFLIVHRSLKELFETTGVRIEILPFTLIDHKGRVASKDHFIANVIGTFDCIDFANSKINYGETHKDVITSVERLVLDPKKLATAPDLFRIDRQPTEYVISEAFGKRIAALNPTNVTIHKLEQSGAP